MFLVYAILYPPLLVRGATRTVFQLADSENIDKKHLPENYCEFCSCDISMGEIDSRVCFSDFVWVKEEYVVKRSTKLKINHLFQ